MQITKSELQSNEEQDIWIENLQGMFVLLMIFRLYQSPSPVLQNPERDLWNALTFSIREHAGPTSERCSKGQNPIIIGN